MPADGSPSRLPDREALILRLAAELLSGDRSKPGPTLIMVSVDLAEEAAAPLFPELQMRAFGILSERLESLVRSSEFLARLGASRFAILVHSDASAFTIENRVVRILEALDSVIEMGSDLLSAKSVAGVARYPEGGRESEALLRNAEAALAIANQENVPYRFWHDGLDDPFQEQKRLERDLGAAIKHDQLELHFQPLIDAETGEIQGMEALARWQRPGYGWVPPLTFFPVAQTCGLLGALEEWVLRRAASTYSNWRRRGISRGRLSINCVPSFLEQPTFAPMVQSILNLQDLDGEAVEFEVAEDSFQVGSTVQVESLVSLRESGMRIAIDDFRWSRLTEQQLTQLPVDRLKIAPDCVPGSAREIDQRGAGAVALSIIQIAQQLGLDVTAEGVETKAQRDFLLENGCRVMQGFYFAKPMTPLDAAVLLRRGHLEAESLSP